MLATLTIALVVFAAGLGIYLWLCRWDDEDRRYFEELYRRRYGE